MGFDLRAPARSTTGISWPGSRCRSAIAASCSTSTSTTSGCGYTSHRFTAMPITVAYRGHVREMSPGTTFVFRLVKPPGDRAPCSPAVLERAVVEGE
jgi:hypothetical protein